MLLHFTFLYATSNMLKLTNLYRKMHGLKDLKVIEPLRLASDLQANTMCKESKLTHKNPLPNKKTLRKRLDFFNFKGTNIGENIAKQQNNDFKEVFKVWSKSPLHRKNILGDYSFTGISSCVGKDKNRYWVQVFGKGSVNWKGSPYSKEKLEEGDKDDDRSTVDQNDKNNEKVKMDNKDNEDIIFLLKDTEDIGKIKDKIPKNFQLLYKGSYKKYVAVEPDEKKDYQPPSDKNTPAAKPYDPSNSIPPSTRPYDPSTSMPPPSTSHDQNNVPPHEMPPSTRPNDPMSPPSAKPYDPSTSASQPDHIAPQPDHIAPQPDHIAPQPDHIAPPHEIPPSMNPVDPNTSAPPSSKPSEIPPLHDQNNIPPNIPSYVFPPSQEESSGKEDPSMPLDNINKLLSLNFNTRESDKYEDILRKILKKLEKLEKEKCRGDEHCNKEDKKDKKDDKKDKKDKKDEKKDKKDDNKDKKEDKIKDEKKDDNKDGKKEDKIKDEKKEDKIKDEKKDKDKNESKDKKDNNIDDKKGKEDKKEGKDDKDEKKETTPQKSTVTTTILKTVYNYETTTPRSVSSTTRNVSTPVKPAVKGESDNAITMTVSIDPKGKIGENKDKIKKLISNLIKKDEDTPSLSDFLKELVCDKDCDDVDIGDPEYQEM